MTGRRYLDMGELAEQRREEAEQRHRSSSRAAAGGDAHGTVEEGSGLEEITETSGLDPVVGRMRVLQVCLS